MTVFFVVDMSWLGEKGLSGTSRFLRYIHYFPVRCPRSAVRTRDCSVEGARNNLTIKHRIQHSLLGADVSFAKLMPLNKRSMSTGNTIFEGPPSDFVQWTITELPRHPQVATIILRSPSRNSFQLARSRQNTPALAFYLLTDKKHGEL